MMMMVVHGGDDYPYYCYCFNDVETEEAERKKDEYASGDVGNYDDGGLRKGEIDSDD